MSEILSFAVAGAAIVALIIATGSFLLSRSTDKSVEKVKRESVSMREQLADMKAQINHVDLDYIKKILVRVTDHEQTMKRIDNDIQLTDEKLKSFMNRTNARLPRPSRGKEEEPAEQDQQDLIESLKANGKAFPLIPEGQPPQPQPTRFVRASALRNQG